ncbi:MAG: HAMP domain-containing histidine kinase [Flavobacteriales bacterium]|nr:HAMP domain-containing histidine kinase [Flavobacteriales bacterium]
MSLPKADQEQAERLHRFAHDLRNRLAAIQQVLGHLTHGTSDTEQLELKTFGEQQYFKAMREVERLLDDLQVDRTPGPSATAPLDATPVLERAIADLQHRFSRKEQEVVVSGTLSPVLAEPRALNDLLSALLSNASKFSPAGSIIRVLLSNSKSHAHIEVQDAGVGLDAEDLDQVFVRYAWLKSVATAGEAQGRSTLARARQWAEAMGGQLAATSAGPGKGCTFTVRLALP